MTLKTTRALSILSLIFLVATGFTPDTTTTIKGRIVETANQQAIGKAYVYIVAGEEETLSLSNGEFSIRTWQKFPITVIVEHSQYKQQKAVLTKNEEALVISLARKN